MSLNTANIAAYVAGSNIGPDMDAISASVSCVISVSFITFHRTIVNAHTILYSLT